MRGVSESNGHSKAQAPVGVDTIEETHVADRRSPPGSHAKGMRGAMRAGREVLVPFENGFGRFHGRFCAFLCSPNTAHARLPDVEKHFVPNRAAGEPGVERSKHSGRHSQIGKQ